MNKLEALRREIEAEYRLNALPPEAPPPRMEVERIDCGGYFRVVLRENSNE